MLGGKQVVFLSCMASYADQLARPIRDRLNDAGYHAVIVMDEPSLRGDFGPEDKVNGYLEAADAFVALATHDDRMGATGTAGNILDEIGRARRLPGLREVVLVMKEETVKLPSNINPVYEQINPDDPDAAFGVIKRQLDTWGVVPAVSAKPPPVTALPENYLDELFEGVGIGDQTITDARLRKLFGTISKQDQHRVARDIFERLLTLPDNGDAIYVVGGFLEACARIDAALIEPSWVEQLVDSSKLRRRMSAVLILWHMAVVDPGNVPLDYIAKLAKPSTEDWYVYSPAIAAAKQLALSRRAALEILLDLASSPEVTDRFTAMHALMELADVEPAIVWFCASDQVRQLAKDADEDVAGPAGELLTRLARSEQARRVPTQYGQFSL